MNIDVTLITVFFGIYGLVYAAGLAYLLLRRPRARGVARAHAFSLLVPASNEENVIAQTVRTLLAFDYPADRFEILVIDDGSVDRTGAILEGLAARYPGRLRVLHIPPEKARRGKAAALNAGFRHLLQASPFREREDWIIGIFDADCLADPRLLQAVSHRFLRARVGGVQSLVRIYNRHHSALARIQDVEFTGLSAMQLIRVALFGSSHLGGNGQFARAEALLSVRLPGAPVRVWREEILTEDLELNNRLFLRNWDFEFVGEVGVQQEGVERFRDLFRQRTRWAWGTLQVFTEYVLRGRVFTHPGTRLKKRVDLLLHLLVYMTSPVVFFTWFLTLLAAFGLVALVNIVPPLATLLLSAVFLPIILYGLWPHAEYRGARKLRYALLFGAYSYHWIPCYLRALVHMLRRDRPRWLKTPRIAPPG